MDPDTLNCITLRIHVDKNNNIIPSHAIQRQTNVSARYGGVKKQLSKIHKFMKIVNK